MKVRILTTGIGDLEAGREFYNRQAPGVGEYFLDSLFADIDSLVLFAGVHPILHGYHRMLAKRFPFAIYYRIDSATALVWRVLDLRRDPHWIARSLEDRD
jgi:plasmid stabilization system protein ParE